MDFLFPRRAFIKLSLASLYGVGSYDRLLLPSIVLSFPVDPVTQQPDYYAAVFSEAQAQEFGGDRSRSMRTIQALAEIWRLSIQANNADPLERDRIAKKIEIIITEGRQFDPATFDSFASFLAGGSLDAMKDAQTLGSYAGKILSSAGAFLGLLPTPINKGAALALSLGGTWAEDVIVTLAKPGLNLAFLPTSEPDRVSLLNKMAYAKMVEGYKGSEALREVISDSEISKNVGIDFSQSFQALIDQLGDQVKSIVESTIGTDINEIKNSVAKTNELIEQLSTEVSKRFDQLDAKTDQILTILKESQKEKEYQEEQQRRLQYFKNEVQGAIVIGATLLTAIFGPKVGKVFEGACRAVITVATAFSQVAAGVMGPFGLAAAFVSAGSLLSGLFSDHPSEFEMLESHIQRVEDRIIALGEFIDARLSQIDERQRQTIGLVIDVLREVQTGNIQAHDHFVQIERRFDDLEQLYLQTERATQQQQYAGTVSGCADFLGNPIFPDLSNVPNLNRYQNYLNDFYNYAIEVSKNPTFCATPLDLIDNNLAEVHRRLGQAIKQYRRVEYLYALIPDMGSLIGSNVSLSELTSLEPDKGQLRNPLEWARGAQHYLQARMHATSVWANPARLTDLWSQGVRLREASIAAGTGRSLRKASLAYADSVVNESSVPDLASFIELKLEEWASSIDPETQTRNIQEFTIQASSSGGVPNKITYRATLMLYIDYVTFNVDPVSLAVEKGLITKQPIKTISDAWGESTAYKIQLKVELELPSIYNDIFESSSYYEYRNFASNTIVAGNGFDGVRVLPPYHPVTGILMSCISLFRELYEYDKVRYRLSNWMRRELNNVSDTVNSFECYAGIAKVFSCLNALCSTRYGDYQPFLDTKNVPLISNRVEISDWFSSYLLGDWSFHPDDFSNLPGFISHLKDVLSSTSKPPITNYILSRFSTTLKKDLATTNATKPDPSLVYRLNSEMNKLLADPNLYEKQRFSNIQLSIESKRLIGTKPNGIELARLNRRLLESVYPDYLKTVPRERHLYRPLIPGLSSDHLNGLPWSRLILDVFRTTMLNQARLLLAQADYTNVLESSIVGPVFIDETLRQLGGFLTIAVGSPPVPDMPGGYLHEASVRFILDQIIQSSQNAFADLKDQLIVEGSAKQLYSSKVSFPGADESIVAIDASNQQLAYFESVFKGSKYERGDYLFRSLITLIDSLSNRGWTVLKSESAIASEYISATQSATDVKIELYQVFSRNGYEIKLNVLSPGTESVVRYTDEILQKQIAYLVQQSRLGFNDIHGELIGLYPRQWKADIEVPGVEDLFIGMKNVYDKTDNGHQCYGVVDSFNPRSILKEKLILWRTLIQNCTPGWSYETNSAGTKFEAKGRIDEKELLAGLRIRPISRYDARLRSSETVFDALIVKFMEVYDEV